MLHYRRSLATILVILLVMGCAGLTAFRTSGEQIVYTAIAYYSAVDSHDGFMGTIVDSARTVFPSTNTPAMSTYISAQRSASGEYFALVFDGQIITAPQLRGDSPDGSSQISKLSNVQLAKYVEPEGHNVLSALHLITKENVELLM